MTPYSKYPHLLDTLLGFLRTEQRPAIRGQTLRLLGLLGALDPYKHKMNTGQIDTESFQLAPLIPINDSTSEMEQSYEMSPSEMLVNMGTGGTLDDFYPSVAIGNVQLFVNVIFILYARWRFKIVCLQTKLVSLAIRKK